MQAFGANVPEDLKYKQPSVQVVTFLRHRAVFETTSTTLLCHLNTCLFETGFFSNRRKRHREIVLEVEFAFGDSSANLTFDNRCNTVLIEFSVEDVMGQICFGSRAMEYAKPVQRARITERGAVVSTTLNFD